MAKHKGFTLIEGLFTTLILVTGLTAVAGAFSYSSLRSRQVLQQTAAIALVSTRMEDLRAAEEILPGWYSEYLVLMPNGTTAVSEPASATYQRTWEITSEMPRRITVSVYGRSSTRSGSFRELARATTLSAR
jgi:Tfp pilus assembly protein PilV